MFGTLYSRSYESLALQESVEVAFFPEIRPGCLHLEMLNPDCGYSGGTGVGMLLSSELDQQRGYTSSPRDLHPLALDHVARSHPNDGCWLDVRLPRCRKFIAQPVVACHRRIDVVDQRRTVWSH